MHNLISIEKNFYGHVASHVYISPSALVFWQISTLLQKFWGVQINGSPVGKGHSRMGMGIAMQWQPLAFVFWVCSFIISFSLLHNVTKCTVCCCIQCMVMLSVWFLRITEKHHHFSWSWLRFGVLFDRLWGWFHSVPWCLPSGW